MISLLLFLHGRYTEVDCFVCEETSNYGLFQSLDEEDNNRFILEIRSNILKDSIPQQGASPVQMQVGWKSLGDKLKHFQRDEEEDDINDQSRADNSDNEEEGNLNRVEEASSVERSGIEETVESLDRGIEISGGGDKEKRDEEILLEVAARKVAINRTLIMVTCSSGYLDLLLNWKASADRLNVSNYIIVPTDMMIAQQLSFLGKNIPFSYTHWAQRQLLCFFLLLLFENSKTAISSPFPKWPYWAWFPSDHTFSCRN